MKLLLRVSRAMFRYTKVGINWIKQLSLSAIILGVLIFIVVNFYIFSSIVNLNSFFYAFLLLSLLTDGAFILLHLPRRSQVGKRKAYFNPKMLTVVIASYNGQDVIAETVKNVAVHVPLNQIIVVSDASTDNTATVARALGVRVIVNKKNLHKVGSINAAMEKVDTPYVLILDDDTMIGKTFIPTSLLDDGYTAVAFNVMPVKEKTLLNELQQFEYRSTMQMSKNLRAGTGAIGNISGAIGLYRSADLRKQIKLHSGQFAGEDEQRTLLAHMYGEGKGITYTDSLVLTYAPDTYRNLFRQRAFSWCIATPELFILYWRVMLSRRFHYLLKMEKAYLIYIFLTEPLRILFIWALFARPRNLLFTYAFYLALNMLIWVRLGRKDTLRAIILSPVYTLGLTFCRFVGYFYWLREKTNYLAAKKHKLVEGRRLLPEYLLILLIIIGSWAVSVQHFRTDLNLFNKIRSENLTDNQQAFRYDANSQFSSLLASSPGTEDSVTVLVEQGDNRRSLAHKAVDKLLIERTDLYVADDIRWKIDQQVMESIVSTPIFQPNLTINVPRQTIIDAIQQNQ